MSADAAVIGTPERVYDTLFRPASVAVVGASRALDNYGGRVLTLLRKYGFAGSVYAVNPRYESVCDYPCYPDLKNLPERPDLVVLAVPKDRVLGVLRECAEAGVRAAVIFAGGFVELDAAGAALQNELRAVADAAGMLVVGPNCIGAASLRDGTVASFTAVLLEHQVPVGDIAVVAQSGLTAGLISDELVRRGLGISHFVATGNEAVLGTADLAEAILASGQTTSLALAIEGVRDGPRFEAACRAAAEGGIPMSVLKVGRTSAGRKATVSHTGALPIDDAVLRAVCRNYGVSVAETLEQLIDLTSAQSLPRHSAGARLAVVSTSGGLGALAADLTTSAGLELATFSAATEQRLTEVTPTFVGVGNPLDISNLATVDQEGLGHVLTALAADPSVDQMLFTLGLQPRGIEETVDVIATCAAAGGADLVVGWVGAREELVASVWQRGVRVSASHEAAVRMVIDQARSAAHADAGWRAERRAGAARAARVAAGGADGKAGAGAGRAVLPPARATPPEWASFLTAFNLSPVPTDLVGSAEELRAVLERTGGPVIVKLWSAEPIHRTELGGVRRVNAQADVEAEFAAISDLAHSVGALVIAQPCVEGLAEIFVGIKVDDLFGPVVLVGSGGIYVESTADSVVLVPPVDERSVLAALHELTVAPALFGARERPAADVPALIATIREAGRLAQAMPALGLAVFELNPVIACGAGPASASSTGSGNTVRDKDNVEAGLPSTYTLTMIACDEVTLATTSPEPRESVTCRTD